MQLEMKTRPSSAGGRMETQNIPSLLSAFRPVRGPPLHPQSSQTGWSYGALSGRSEFSEELLEKSPKPEWLERELLKQEHRRHSFTFGDDKKFSLHQTSTRRAAYTSSKLKMEQKVSLENLTKLKSAFEDFERAENKPLDLQNFSLIIKTCLGMHTISDSQIQELFMKIDHSGRGRVQWEEFCTYMQLEYAEKHESRVRGKQTAFTLPARMKPLPHGEPVLRIHHTPDGALVTVREDGTVSYWSSSLQLRKSKSVFPERPIGRKPKWATDFITMPQYNKLIVGTGDREIQLYELSSLEPYCQINSLETVPMKLDYCYTGSDRCAIVYGDTQGCVNIILITSVGETLRLWKKLPKVENVPSVGIDLAALSPNVSFIRWKVHQDWVTKVKYYPSLSAIVSTSNHETSALVIGCILPSTNIEQQLKEIKEAFEGKPKKASLSSPVPQQRAPCDQTVFSVYKGVMTFDLCKKHKLLVTGGRDRIIRMWNPYVPARPTGLLKGHLAPIFYLCISSENGRIFSISTDNTARIWDIQDQCCLFTAHPKASWVHGELTACLYSAAVKALYMATDSLAILSLKSKSQLQGGVISSHKEAVLCCGYSQEFRQVVSCSQDSVIKVWDVDTGRQVFEFGGAHGLSAITCMSFDPKGRRLLTGGRDGQLKIWNFNNGQCLKILSQEGRSDEICDCSYLQVHRNTFVISVGWSRRIDVYVDSPDDTHHIERPQPPWQEDLNKGHREDILSIAHCPPYLIATGSYDGEIIVWNMVSGHIQCRFLTPLPPNTKQDYIMDRSVLSVFFLRTRVQDAVFSSAATLVSSGAQGFLHFWNVLSGGKLITSFKASRLDQQISKLSSTQDDALLFASDFVGYVYAYDIKECGVASGHKRAQRLSFWRAHIGSITGLQVMDQDRVLLTSSTDCTVRLWSLSGQFIGTFGQPDRWSLHTASSWKHPAVPDEILLDPLSMPRHEMLDGTATHSDPNLHHSERNEETSREVGSVPSCPHDGDTDLGSFSSEVSPDGGKWLRHELFKQQNKLLNYGGLKAYHALRYFEGLDPVRTWENPNLSLTGGGKEEPVMFTLSS